MDEVEWCLREDKLREFLSKRTTGDPLHGLCLVSTRATLTTYLELFTLWESQPDPFACLATLCIRPNVFVPALIVKTHEPLQSYFPSPRLLTMYKPISKDTTFYFSSRPHGDRESWRLKFGRGVWTVDTSLLGFVPDSLMPLEEHFNYFITGRCARDETMDTWATKYNPELQTWQPIYT